MARDRGLAFAEQPELLEASKLGILLGSILSGVMGALVLRLSPRVQEV